MSAGYSGQRLRQGGRAMSGLLPGVHVCLSGRPRLQVMRSGRGPSSAACRMAVEMQIEMETETDESLREW